MRDMACTTLSCEVDPYHDGWSLLDYLCHRFRYLPRETWECRLAAGKVRLSGMTASGGTVVARGDVVTYEVSAAEPAVDSGYGIVFEDDKLLVVSKSGNIPVHAGGKYILNTLVARVRGDVGVNVNLAHRLDRETSGLVVLTKTRDAARSVSSAFAGGRVRKVYIAVVHGNPEESEFRVDGPIAKAGREHPVPRRVVDAAAGKTAVTVFNVVERFERFAVVEAKPATGRTHQVRVHLEHAGHPVVGDKIYGVRPEVLAEYMEHGMTPRVQEALLLPRHALHLKLLRLLHPRTGAPLTLEAPIPPDMSSFIEARRLEVRPRAAR